MNKTPGIFNDVMGPVMRGPSSSHTAASWRIGRMCLAIIGNPLKEATIAFDKSGAWAPNYEEQGTVMGMNGGLLGLEMTDEKMKEPEATAQRAGVRIAYEVSSFPTTHPNTLRLTLLTSTRETFRVTAVSLGGGSFTIREVNGAEVNLCGDYYELLVWTKKNGSVLSRLRQIISGNLDDSISEGGESTLVNIKSRQPFTTARLDKIKRLPEVEQVVQLDPVLPIISGHESPLPFASVPSMLDYALEKGLNAGQLGLVYEQCYSGLPSGVLNEKMQQLIRIIDNSIATGLAGTHFKDRILPRQSHLPGQAVRSGQVPNHKLINAIIANVTAIMESKSAMEVIVANPTAGSCGTVGGVLKAVGDALNSSEEMIVQAYFAAGMVGAWFAMGPGFSAEEHGCQVECGAASGMAAAGIVQLYGGTAQQAMDAASMAIQNMIGLVCDPVADRVEVPCLGKNISAAMNALTSATMACAGFDAVIPLEEVIQTVSAVSRQMPSCIKCTGKGGLAITPAAQSLKEQLKNQQ